MAEPSGKEGVFWVQGGMKAAAPASSPAARPAPFEWPRAIFPFLVVVVMGGFALGASVRGSSGLLDAFRPPLEIRSDPPGATVFIDGRLAGATPLRITSMKPGEYAVRLERDGCQPVIRKVRMEGRLVEIDETLPEVATGRLQVVIEPEGAEVLLDGELVGHTPLHHEKIPVGQHELVVRKTNFENFVQTVNVQAGELVEYKGFELRDKILVMLRRNIESEPQRVGHYVDLGHYLFVNDELEESAKAYAKALSVAASPLKLPEEMPQPEKDLEYRLRSEDTQRMNDEMRKKENWPGKDVALFKAKIEEAQDQVAREHIDSWGWVKQAGDVFMRRQKYERAEDLYVRHLAALPKEGDTSGPLLGLIVLRLRMHNLSSAKESFAALLASCAKRPDILRSAGREVFGQQGNFRDLERAEVLGMAEKLTRTAYEGCPKGDLKALCASELGQTLRTMDRFEAALPYFKEAIEVNDEPTRQQRQLDLAGCLLRAQNLPEARALYEALQKSAAENIRRAAEQGLKSVEAREAKLQKTPKK
ncbi:MAG: PEGA domain-containing protein [Planctomycetota bacterium]|nr:PEGA domain-containing protein [Planctomycetota bacterium]